MIFHINNHLGTFLFGLDKVGQGACALGHKNTRGTAHSVHSLTSYCTMVWTVPLQQG